jgi:hypothetical protein
MEWLTAVLNFLFGCRHRNLSRVFTIGGQTYCVCRDCGATFSYSLENMSIMHRNAAPRVTALRSVQTS